MAKKAASKTAGKAGTKSAGRAGGARRSRAIEAPPMPEGAVRTPVPIDLGGVIGQERAVGVLRSAAGSGRLHHAWIFHGPLGVGKFTTALAWAGVLLDPTTAPGLGGQPEPDPESRVQGLLRAGTHPDLHVIVKELARYSEEAQVRAGKLLTIAKDVIDSRLIRPARLAPVMGGGAASKVFIVDEAELLGSNAAAQNALLKTLEEPPEGTVIILVTSSEDRLLPTIRSRCQRVAFGPLEGAAMERWLGGAGLELAADERAWLVQHAEGSPGRLVRAAKAGLYGWHRAIGPMLERADGGEHPVALGEAMSSLVDDWAKGWVDEGVKVQENRSKEAANREGVAQMLGLIGARYRRQLTDGRTSRGAVEAIDLIARAERLLGSNVSLKLVMEDLAAGLSGRGG